jgi:integrase
MACIRKRGNRYVLDFYDQYGHRQRETLKTGTTKKQAEEELRAKADAVSKRVFVPVKRMLLFSEVAREWLEHKKPNVRITTYEVFQGNVNLHFKELAELKMGLIDTATIEKWIARRQSEGMNINTLRKLIVTLNQIMAYAVRHRYADHNPVRDAERPREQGGEPEGEQIHVLGPDEIKRLLDSTEGQKYQLLFRMAIFTGARQGELLGLKWSDIDWGNKQVHIQRTFNNGRFFDTKTRTSNRRIDLGPVLVNELRKWKLVSGKNDLGLVFSNGTGQPIDHHNLVNRHFLPSLEAAGLLRIRFHDLRHTYASLLIEQGENIKYIQTQLGHSSPTVTLNVYAHLMNQTNQEAACRLEETVFKEGTGHKMVTSDKKEVRS